MVPQPQPQPQVQAQAQAQTQAQSLPQPFFQPQTLPSTSNFQVDFSSGSNLPSSSLLSNNQVSSYRDVLSTIASVQALPNGQNGLSIPYQNNKSSSGSLQRGRKVNNYDPRKDRNNVAFHKLHVRQQLNVNVTSNKRCLSPSREACNQPSVAVGVGVGISDDVNQDGDDGKVKDVNDDDGWQISTGARKHQAVSGVNSGRTVTPIVIRHRRSVTDMILGFFW